MTSALGALSPFEQDGAQVRVAEDGRVLFQGTIAMRNPSASLTPYLRSAHLAALEDNVRELRLDFTQLRFMNSSSIRSLLDWVEWIQQEPEARRYRLQFISNPAFTWQQTTLGVIRSFSEGTVDVTEGM